MKKNLKFVKQNLLSGKFRASEKFNFKKSTKHFLKINKLIIKIIKFNESI